MAETNNQSVWHSIVCDRWRAPVIHGDGPHCVIVRCTETTHAHLFQTEIEALSFQLQFCEHAPVCWKRHSIGTLFQFVPAIAKPRGENLRAYILGND
jgi:hypothetical protein